MSNMDGGQQLQPPGKPLVRTSFKQTRTLESFYTGGKTALAHRNRNGDGGETETWLVATAGDDVMILDLQTGETRLKLESGTGAVTCFAVKHDGTGLVTASRSLLLKTWNLETGKEERSFRGHEAPVLAMDFDATSTLVATGSADSTVKIWDAAGGFATHSFRGHRGLVTCVRFMPDKKNWWTLFTGGEDGQIRVWDLKKKACISVLDSHVSVVRGLDVTANRQQLVSAGRDRVVNIWNLDGFDLQRTIPAGEGVEAVGVVDHAHLPSSLRSSVKATDVLFYTGGEKGIVRVWNGTSGQVLLAQEPEENSNHQIFEVLYDREAGSLVAVTTDQHLLSYSIRESLKRTRQMVGANDEVIDVAFLGNNPNSLALCANSEQIRLYDLDSGSCELLYGHSDVVICIDASKDGELLVSGSKDRTCIVWKKEGNPEQGSVNGWSKWGLCVGHTEAIGAVCMSKKTGAFVLTGSQDRTVKMWDLKGIEKAEKQAKKGGALEEESGPKKLSSVYTVKAHDKDINSIAVSPNDRLFATGSQDKTAKLWNAADGSLVATLTGHRRGVWCVQFSPVDQVLATSSGDKTVKLWSLADRSCLRTFEGHLNSVLRVSFMSQGTQVISSGSDGLIKVWNMKTSECTATMDGGDGKIWALAVAKEGEILGSGGGDSVLRMWSDVTEEESEQKRLENEERMVKEQDLANLLRKKDYRGAILLAMDLGQPYRLLKLFKEVIDAATDESSITGSKEVDAVLKGLDESSLEKMLLYIRDWNTNSRHSRTAQTVLHALLKFFPPRELSKLAKSKEIFDALIPYTERHYQHMTDLVTRSYLMDFTLQSMELLIGDADEDMYEGELDSLWKNRGDRLEAAKAYEKKDDGDALGDQDWEAELNFDDGPIGGDVDGEFIEARGEDDDGEEDGEEDDAAMEDAEFVGGSDGGEEEDGDEMEGSSSDSDSDSNSDSDSDDDEQKPSSGRKLPNGHLANGVGSGSDSDSESSDDS